MFKGKNKTIQFGRRTECQGQVVGRETQGDQEVNAIVFLGRERNDRKKKH